MSKAVMVMSLAPPAVTVLVSARVKVPTAPSASLSAFMSMVPFEVETLFCSVIPSGALSTMLPELVPAATVLFTCRKLLSPVTVICTLPSVPALTGPPVERMPALLMITSDPAALVVPRFTLPVLSM